MWIVGAADLVNLSDSINYFQLDASCLAHCGSGSPATSSLSVGQWCILEEGPVCVKCKYN